MQGAFAAVPSFPDNVTVFPDRDFVSVEGYAAHAGETALVKVTRPGAGVIGSATDVVSGGDVAFEINHPGGVCWGAGTTDKVTPDLQPGDVVSITFPNGSGDETTVSDAMVTGDMALSGTTLTVTGHVGPGVNKDFMEQRVINADLVDTPVARRDIRAIPGPMVRAAKGGYSSELVFPTDDTFAATYVFDDAPTAQIAAAADLGERAMTWQVQDADGNRQGLTIAEFGELGGPGMGGCPAGPGAQAAPPPGAASAVRATDKTVMQVKWTPVAPQPGAAAITGYSVAAIASTVTSGQQVQVGVRTNASATQSTITGLSATENYTVEVRSLAGAKMSDAFTINAAPAAPVGDTTVPTLLVNPAANPTGTTEASVVTVQSNGQIFYTIDGTPVINADLPSDTARLYTGPVPVTGPITLRVAAFDQAGNNVVLQGDYAPPAAPVTAPAAPTGLTATPGQASASLAWNAGDATATGYQVLVYDAAGTQLVAGVQPPETAARVQTVAGLTVGTTYRFSVRAKNASGLFSAESTQASATPTATTDRLTITTATWKSGDFKVVGTGSVVGGTVTVHTATAAGTIGNPIPGAVSPVTAAAAPGIGAFTLRLRNGSAPSQNPGRIFVKSSRGGVAGPFTVASK